MASPSRSGSVARYSAGILASAVRIRATADFELSTGSNSIANPFFVSIDRPPPLRSRTCPLQASTR